MNFLRRYWEILFLVLFTAGGIVFRSSLYPNHSYSVAMNDTDGYIAAAQYPPFSWLSLTAVRPPTVPLIYRVFKPLSGYNLTNVSRASLAGETKQLAPQPGFEGIVIFRSLFPRCREARAEFHALNRRNCEKSFGQLTFQAVKIGLPQSRRDTGHQVPGVGVYLRGLCSSK